MDIVSHGLWGSITFGRKNRKNFWLAFLIGSAPDLLSFGIYSFFAFLGIASGVDWSNGLPDPNQIPVYAHWLYNFTHSLIIFAVVFGIVWIILK
ncbi:hypothetical protein KKD04_00250, partial [Patescibacteria group bacterium]|nr:hypothetical protein [Patescibacteria group bacterium]